MIKALFDWKQARKKRALEKSYREGFNYAVGTMLRAGDEDVIGAMCSAGLWPETDTCRAFDNGVAAGFKLITDLRMYANMNVHNGKLIPSHSNISGTPVYAIENNLNKIQQMLYGKEL